MPTWHRLACQRFQSRAQLQLLGAGERTRDSSSALSCAQRRPSCRLRSVTSRPTATKCRPRTSSPRTHRNDVHLDPVRQAVFCVVDQLGMDRRDRPSAVRMRASSARSVSGPCKSGAFGRSPVARKAGRVREGIVDEDDAARRCQRRGLATSDHVLIWATQHLQHLHLLGSLAMQARSRRASRVETAVIVVDFGRAAELGASSGRGSDRLGGAPASTW